MTRSSKLALATLTVLLAAACNTAADNQAKADKAQAVATDKVTSATIEANQKIANAQAEANQQIDQAHGDFMKRRDDFRQSVMSDLGDVDRNIAKLTAKDEQLSGQAKTDLDMKLAQIRSARASFTGEFQALEGTPAMAWDDMKANVSKKLSALKSLVNDA